VIPAFIISLCGTSCLTHVAAEEHRRLVTKDANAPGPGSVPDGDRAVLEEVFSDARREMLGADVARMRRMSAEINSLAAFYEGDFRRAGADQHFLIHTDTWLGRAAAECVREGLTELGVANVQLVTFGGLRTDSMADFRAALGEMARWCEESIPKEGVHVVFNLTGGFKSVVGFMHTLGLFYADERIYLFEGSSELLRIPRLPVRMDAAEDVRRHLHAIRRLALGLPAEEPLPALYVFEIDGERTLSEWGELIWRQEKPGLYRERLWPGVSPRYRCSDRFKKETEKLSPDRRLAINKRMDELAAHLELPNRPNPNSLHFQSLESELRQKFFPCTHELYAWSDGNAGRSFGWFDGGVFVGDRLEKHL